MTHDMAKAARALLDTITPGLSTRGIPVALVHNLNAALSAHSSAQAQGEAQAVAWRVVRRPAIPGDVVRLVRVPPHLDNKARLDAQPGYMHRVVEVGTRAHPDLYVCETIGLYAMDFEVVEPHPTPPPGEVEAWKFIKRVAQHDERIEGAQATAVLRSDIEKAREFLASAPSPSPDITLAEIRSVWQGAIRSMAGAVLTRTDLPFAEGGFLHTLQGVIGRKRLDALLAAEARAAKEGGGA